MSNKDEKARPTTYEIRTSNDGIKFTYRAKFEFGDKSRWGHTFNDEVALLEVNSFKEHRGNEFEYIQLIITL